MELCQCIHGHFQFIDKVHIVDYCKTLTLSCHRHDTALNCIGVYRDTSNLLTKCPLAQLTLYKYIEH